MTPPTWTIPNPTPEQKRMIEEARAEQDELRRLEREEPEKMEEMKTSEHLAKMMQSEEAVNSAIYERKYEKQAKIDAANKAARKNQTPS